MWIKSVYLLINSWSVAWPQAYLPPCFTPLSPEVGIWLRDSEEVKDGGKGGGLVPEEEEEEGKGKGGQPAGAR